MRLATISSTILYFAVTTNLVAADEREQIGEVFGEPVFRDQIQTSGEAVRNDLHRLFTSPVLDRYKRAHRNEIEPTEKELAAAVAHDRATFYEYWTTMKHGAFLSGKKDQVKRTEFLFPWESPEKDQASDVDDAGDQDGNPDKQIGGPKLAVLDRIEVREIVLRDTENRPRARIGFDQQNVLRFSASADDQRDRFFLSVFPDGRAALIFRDGRGRNRIALSIREDGRPIMTLDDNATIILHDDRGRNRAVLRTAEDGSPQLSLYDEDMKATVIQPQAGQ